MENREYLGLSVHVSWTCLWVRQPEGQPGVILGTVNA